jgi:RNA polymerase sigma-70 factor (ECF subfamily)
MSTPQAQFEALVHAHAADLYRYAIWLGNRAPRADDLVQETFLRAWKALGTLRNDTSARAWLFTILRREHARQFERTSGDVVALEDVGRGEVPGEDGIGGEALAVRQAVAALPMRYREPLLLQVLGGHSCNEIGEILGIEPGAVMTRLFRARQKLRRCLGAGDRPRRRARLT